MNSLVKYYEHIIITLFMSMIMPNPITNQTKQNASKDIIKDIMNLFRLKKKKDSDIKDNVIIDIRTWFESDEENYYEPLRIGNSFSSNFSKYESNTDKGKTLSVEENILIRLDHI